MPVVGGGDVVARWHLSATLQPLAWPPQDLRLGSGCHANPPSSPPGKPVIFATLLTLCEAGDEVVYPDPGFPAYRTTIEYVGAVPVPLPVRPPPPGDLAPRSGNPQPLPPNSRIVMRGVGGDGSRARGCAPRVPDTLT